MANETTITVVGNAVEAPELRFTPSGAAVAKFRIASTPRTFDKTEQKWIDGEPMFLPVSVWRQAAEHVADSVVKGTRLIVQGRLKQRSYETKEGERRTVYEIDADEVGVSLTFATATVKKMARSNGDTGGNPARIGGNDDPWSTPATAGAAASTSFDETPPF